MPQYKPTVRFNMRSGADTSSGVVKVLPQGTVIAGTVSANGYTWYKVTVGNATGWLTQRTFVQAVGH